MVGTTGAGTVMVGGAGAKDAAEAERAEGRRVVMAVAERAATVRVEALWVVGWVAAAEDGGRAVAAKEAAKVVAAWEEVVMEAAGQVGEETGTVASEAAAWVVASTAMVVAVREVGEPLVQGGAEAVGTEVAVVGVGWVAAALVGGEPVVEVLEVVGQVAGARVVVVTVAAVQVVAALAVVAWVGVATA